MAEKEELKSPVGEEYVYRLSTADEWDELQSAGATSGGDIDHRTGCIHLSSLRQVKTVLKRFYQGREDLFLLQIDTAKVLFIKSTDLPFINGGFLYMILMLVRAIRD